MKKLLIILGAAAIVAASCSSKPQETVCDLYGQSYVDSLESVIKKKDSIILMQTRMIGACYDHDDCYFLDVIMEGDKWWDIQDYYKSIGKDFYIEMRLDSAAYNY